MIVFALVLATPLALNGAAASARPPDLPALRQLATTAETAAVSARVAAETAQQNVKAVEEDLRRKKEALAAGKGNEAEVRSLSARARDLSGALATLRVEADAAADRWSSARESLREALFDAASDRSAEGDLQARSGKPDEAQRAYIAAAKLLLEASMNAPVPESGDPWESFAEIPLRGDESQTEKSEIASAYRSSSARIHQRVASYEARRSRLEPAVTAWNRLSRFRGVLERTGAEAADPTVESERLDRVIKSGREREALLLRLSNTLDGATPIASPSHLVRP